MTAEDIKRISDAVGYVIFFVVYFGTQSLLGKKVGKSILKRNPRNVFLPLYYPTYVKASWKAIYFAIGFLSFVVVSFITGIVLLAVPIAYGLVFYAGDIIAKLSKTSAWEDGLPPTPEDVD